MPRNADPDGILDADRGRSRTPTKNATFVPPDEHVERATTRAGLLELDQMTEQLPGLNRLQRDRARITPRDAAAPLGHPVMQRPLLEPDAVRTPFSSRQKKARSKTRCIVEAKLPDALYAATRDMATNPQLWYETNNALSDVAGDVDQLDEDTRQHIARLDSALRTYEAHNDRGHVVYANLRMPTYINSSNLTGFCRNTFTPGATIAFDRYTHTTHQLHETSRTISPAELDRTAVFEIQTRRGAYLGGSDSRDDTGHLLPRSMRLEVIGTYDARYQRPDGTRGTRTVVQLRDVTPEPSRAQEERGSP